MPWFTTVVAREKLYQEVWAEPVVKVAKRYGVSDVALRKVCIKLSVPMPPAGYWAKLMHGKPTRRPALPSKANRQQHSFQRWVAPVDEELQARLAAVHADRAEGRTRSDLVVQTNPSSWHGTVKRTASALRNEFPRLPESWRAAKGAGHFSLYASKGSAERALILLDLLVRLCVDSALELEGRAGEELPARVLIQDYAFTFRVVERATRVERELTSNERGALYRDKGPFVPSRITKQGSGQLRLEVLDVAGHAILSRSDTRNQRLEDVIHDIPAALKRHALEQSVRDALAKERAERAEAERQRRQALIDIKKGQLSRLEAVEKEAAQWLRARRLERYAKALHTRADSDSTPSEARERLIAEARWVEVAAAWLNPLVRQHWPEVDDAPDSVYAW